MRILRTSRSIGFSLTTSRCSQSLRRAHSTSSSADDPNTDSLQMLLLNKELTPEDASSELRWIKDEVRSEAERMMAKGRLPPIEHERIGEMVRRRSTGEPLQYILGSTDFGPLNIVCRRPVLIPRPETAHIFTQLSSHIISSIPPLTSALRPSSPLPILDLCTGTACIPLLMARLNPLTTFVGVDKSPAAVGLGGVNVQQLNMGDRVEVKYGNVFGEPQELLGAQGKVGLVVSNPPYIPLNEWEQLPKSVKEFESPSALLGDGMKDGEGLAFYERIAEILPHILMDERELESKGWKGIPRVAVEVGLGQADKVGQIFRGRGLSKTEIWNDQYGVARMVVGWSQ